jgi:hypothetical protein
MSNLSISYDTDGLLIELGLLPGISKPARAEEDQVSAISAWIGGTLFCAAGAVTRLTVPYHDLYGSMSLFGWLLALAYLALEFITSDAR